MSSEMMKHQNLAIPQNTDFWLGGPGAVENYKQGGREVRVGPNNTAVIGFKGYDIDNNMPAIEPFTEYIEYMEYNHWRDIEANEPANPKASTNRRLAAIFDIDADDWRLIRAEDIIDGCYRFRPGTGEPIGINNVKRGHNIAYSPSLLVDSFHTKAGDNLRPIMLNLTINKAHFTHRQAREKCAIQSAMKLKDLPADAADIIQNGLDALAAIEAASIVDVAETINYITASLAGAQPIDVPASNKLAKAYGGNVKVLRQITLPKGAPNQIPILSGNWAGFQLIASSIDAAAAQQSTSPNPLAAAVLKFAADTGISAKLALDIYQFVRVVKIVVRQIRQFYPMSLAVDPAFASPWAQSAEATFFENVIAPRPRSVIRTAAGITTLAVTPAVAAALAVAPEGVAPAYSIVNMNEPGKVAAAGDRAPYLLPASAQSSGLPGLPVAVQLLAASGVVLRTEAVEAQAPANDVVLGGGDVNPLGKRAAQADLAPPAKRSTGTLSAIEQAIAADLAHPNSVENWNAVAEDSSLTHIERWMYKSWALNLFNANALKTAAARDMPLPFSALLFRQMTVASDTIIKVEAGDCGYQLVGHPMYMFSPDGKLGVLSAQFSYYYKAKVTKPENVFQVRLKKLFEAVLALLTPMPRSDRQRVPARLLRWLRLQVHRRGEPQHRVHHRQDGLLAEPRRHLLLARGVQFAPARPLPLCHRSQARHRRSRRRRGGRRQPAGLQRPLLQQGLWV